VGVDDEVGGDALHAEGHVLLQGRAGKQGGEGSRAGEESQGGQSATFDWGLTEGVDPSFDQAGWPVVEWRQHGQAGRQTGGRAGRPAGVHAQIQYDERRQQHPPGCK
jgi:hypothetical protein